MTSQGHFDDQTFHDAIQSSDSNEEFASASEGDDDLPWEPIVSKSPVIARQNLQLQQDDQLHHSQLHSPSTFISGRRNDSQENDSKLLYQLHDHSQQYHLYKPSQHQQRDQLQEHHESQSNQTTSYHVNDNLISSTSTSQTYSQTHAFTQHRFGQQQEHHSFTSTTTSILPSMTSSASAHAQFGYNRAIPRSVTPRLRERMRQSPVLQSKVVQAYLDPMATQIQTQTMTPEHVRQAWLKDHMDNQESSEDEVNYEDEAEADNEEEPTNLTGQHSSISGLGHVQIQHQSPSILSAQQIGSSVNLGTVSLQDQLQDEESWGFDDNIDVEEVQQESTNESWGVETNINTNENPVSPRVNIQQEYHGVITQESTTVDHSESSWGFEGNININEVTQENREPPRLENKNVIDDWATSEQIEDSWGFDDQLNIVTSTDDYMDHTSNDKTRPESEQHHQIQQICEDEDDGWDKDDQMLGDIHPSAAVDINIGGVEVEDSAISNNLTEHSDSIVNLSEDQIDSANPFLTPEEIEAARQEQLKSAEEPIVPGVAHQPSNTFNTQEQSVESSSLTLQQIDSVTYSQKVESAEGNLSRDVHSIESRVVSTDFSVEGDGEASWGFDMDEAIEIDEQVVIKDILPISGGIEGHQQDDGLINQPQLLDSESQLESDVEESDQIGDAKSSSGHGIESDNEHDSEVREVLQVAHSGSLIDTTNPNQPFTNISRNPLPTERSPQSPQDAEIDKDIQTEKESLPVHAQILHISTVELPQFVEARNLDTPVDQPTTLIVNDTRAGGSDSDISFYGDLSTARTAFVGSSNRLNEIEDDDYLEHMERGVPMSRPTSTPTSDEEQPKFIMDDELVERMERGETHAADTIPTDHLETLNDDDEVIPALELEADGNVISTQTLDELESAADDALITASESLDAAQERSQGDIVTSNTVELDHVSSDISVAIELEQELLKTTERMSDDRDPDNPFSDAAALDEGEEAWLLGRPVQSSTVVSQQPNETAKDSFILSHENITNSETTVTSAIVFETANIEISSIQENRTSEYSDDREPLKSSITNSMNDNDDEIFDEGDGWDNQGDINDIIITSNTKDEVESTTLSSMSRVHESEVRSSSQVLRDIVSEEHRDERVFETSTYPVLELHSRVANHREPLSETPQIQNLTEECHDESVTTTIITTSSTTTTALATTVNVHQKEQVEVLQDVNTINTVIAIADSDSAIKASFNNSVDEAFEEDGWNNQEDDIIHDSELNEVMQGDNPEQVDQKVSDIAFQESAREVNKDTIHQSLLTSIDDSLGEDSWNDQDIGLTLAPIDDVLDEVRKTERSADALVEIFNKTEYSQNSLIESVSENPQEDQTTQDGHCEMYPNETHETHQIQSIGKSEISVDDQSKIDEDTSSTTMAREIEPESTDDIDKSIRQVIDDNAWDDQDAWSDHEVEVAAIKVDSSISSTISTKTIDTRQVHETQETQEIHDSHQVLNKAEDDIIEALEADGWGDQDIDIDIGINTVSTITEVAVSSSTDTVTLYKDSQEESKSLHQQDFEGFNSQSLSRHSQDTESAIPIPHNTHSTSEEVKGSSDQDQSTDVDTVNEFISECLALTSSVEESHDRVDDLLNQAEISPPASSQQAIQEPRIPLETNLDVNEALEVDAWNTQDDLDISLEPRVSGTLSPIDAAKESQPLEVLITQSQITQSQISISEESKYSTTSHSIEAAQDQLLDLQAKPVTDDAWGWDEDDDIDIDLADQSQMKQDGISEHPDQKKVDLMSVEDSRHETGDFEPYAADGHKAISSLLSSHSSPTTRSTSERFTHLSIKEGHVSSGTNSGEGEEDAANQSPWQDVSPASASKRSETGLISEVESEFSVRSLDEFERVSPIPGHARNRSTGSGSGSITSEPIRGITSTMSWTDLKHDEWETNTHDAAEFSINDRTEQIPASLSKRAQASIDSTTITEIDEIGGADRWDFENDIGLEASAPKSLTTNIPHEPEHSTVKPISEPSLTSVSTSSSHVLSQHSSLVSTSSSFESPKETAPVEVEDDSHLPLAIRQQRARLAAKGKPLPPISKYKKVTTSKESVVDQFSERTLSSTQTLPTGVTSSVISSASPIKPPVSPTIISGSTSVVSTSTDQKYLTPALLKQRERLEKKKAAAAAGTSTSLLTSYKVSSTESTPDLSSSKVTSPLLSSSGLSSTLKHVSVFSPTSIRKSSILEIKEQSSGSVLSSPTTEEFGQSTRRRGLSTSSVSSTSAIPTSPLASSFIRRGKEVDQQKNLQLSSTETKDVDNVARTSQSDTYRYTSRISTSSSQSGWDDFEFGEDGEKERSSGVIGTGVNKSPSFKKDLAETTVTTRFSSSSSSSFYKQVVPGLDDVEDSSDRFGKSSTSSATLPSAPHSGLGLNLASSSSSSYLSNKKADDYDPYGPSKDRLKSTVREDDGWTDNQEEVLIGQSVTSPGVSLLSPTSTTSISNRHDHQRHSHSHHSNFNTGGNSSVTITTSTFSASSSGGSGGGFFGGSSGSLVGDISNIMNEKKNPASMSSYDNDNKKSSITSSSAKASTSSNLQKSSSWSFGSWVSSAVAVASEAVDKAYESLDPEYSKIKRGESSTSPDGLGSGDPSSSNPYKRPGYVVGGSSLALGLASISIPAQQQQQQPQEQEQHYQQQQQHYQQHKPSPPPSVGFGSSNSSSETFISQHSFSERTSQSQGISPRLTRKNNSGN